MPDLVAEPLRLTSLEARLTPAAYTVDPGFAVTTPDPAALLVQPDGKVIVAARTEIGERLNSVTLTRYNPNGTPDDTFGPGGATRLPLAPADYLPLKVEPRGDGYAVLLRSETAVSVANVPQAGVTGPGFSVTTIPMEFRPADADLVVLPDGASRVGTRPTGAGAIVTDLITPSGQLDALARRQFTSGPGDRGRDLTILPDGSVLVAAAVGPNGEPGSLSKYRPDGTLDAGFDGDGVQTLTAGSVPNSSVEQFAVAPDGTILVYGTSSPDRADPGRDQTGIFSRLTPTGAFDPTFGAGGTALWSADGTARTANGLVVRPQGDAILFGGRGLGAAATPLVARVSERGRITERLSGPLDAQAGPILDAGLTSDRDALVTARPQSVARLRFESFVPEPVIPASVAARTPRSLGLSGPVVGAAVELNGRPDGTYTLDVGAAVPAGFNPGSGARVARGDFDGDGRPDTVFVSGAGAADMQIVLATGEALTLFNPYEAAYRGGLFVAARDLDGDGKAEAVVSPDLGGGAVVVVYSGAKLADGLTGDAAQIARYYGIADREFRGGAKVALGDISGDGRPDMVVTAGDGGGPRVTVWENQSVLAGAPTQLADFFAFDPNYRSGADVAVGNFTAPGQLAVGVGAGGGPHVRVLTANGVNAEPTEVANFMAFDPTSRSGVRLGAIDGDGNGEDDLVVVTGPGRPGALRVFKRAALQSVTPTPSLDIGVFAPGDLASGVYVG